MNIKNVINVIHQFFAGDQSKGTFRTAGTFGIGTVQATGQACDSKSWISPLKKHNHNRYGYKPVTEEMITELAINRHIYKIKPCKVCGIVRYKKIQKVTGEVSVPGMYHCDAIALEDIHPNSYCILSQSPADGRHFIRMARGNDGNNERSILVYSKFGAKKGRRMVNIPSDKGDACFEVKS